jgi:hypothetical protein
MLFFFIKINVANANVDACVGQRRKVFESPLIGIAANEYQSFSIEADQRGDYGSSNLFSACD